LTINSSIIVQNTSLDINSASSSIVQSFNNLTSFFVWNGDYGNNIIYDPSKPLFIDPANGDYHLAEYSQAIDRGNDALAVDAEGNLLVYDLAGNARIQGNAVDIGAYEFIFTQEAPTLTLTADQTNIDEGIANGVIFTAMRTGGLSQALTLNLASSDTTELTVPQTVTIPANQNTVIFQGTSDLSMVINKST
jgi:hypothetical protein